jgi:hypothetical protein
MAHLLRTVSHEFGRKEYRPCEAHNIQENTAKNAAAKTFACSSILVRVMFGRLPCTSINSMSPSQDSCTVQCNLKSDSSSNTLLLMAEIEAVMLWPCL